MRLLTGYETRKHRIEMIPLMDVIFLLLSSFIYATMSLSAQKGLKVDLPRGFGEKLKSGALVISIDRDGALWMNKERVSLNEAVSAASSKSKEGETVLVNGDRQAGLGVAVELLSELRQASVEKVSFQVKNEQEQARP